MKSCLSTYSVSSFDPKELARSSRANVEQRLLKPGLFEQRVVTMDSGDMRLVVAECNLPFVGCGVGHEDRWNLSTLLKAPGPVTVYGAAMQTNQNEICGPGAEIHFITCPHIVFTGFFVEEKKILVHMERLRISGRSFLAHHHGVYQRWGEAATRYMGHLSAMREWEAAGMTILPSSARAFLDNALNDYLLSVVSSSRHVALYDAGMNRYRIVRRVEDYLVAHAGNLVSIDMICQSMNISERSLDYAFRDVLGLSPYNYLSLLRLNKVRARLLASGKPGTVKEPALEWGFSNFSRFARHYKRLFGEVPSETIRRGGDLLPGGIVGIENQSPPAEKLSK